MCVLRDPVCRKGHVCRMRVNDELEECTTNTIGGDSLAFFLHFVLHFFCILITFRGVRAFGWCARLNTRIKHVLALLVVRGSRLREAVRERVPAGVR